MKIEASNQKPLPPQAARAPLPERAVAIARDQVQLSPRKMAEAPQEQFGVVLTPAMAPYAAELDRFVANSLGQIDALAEALRADPEFQRVSAPGRWARLPAAERLAFAEHVSQLQAQILGFKPAQVHLTWERDRDTDGGYDDETGRLDLNRNATAFGDLGEFLNTVVHEQFHCYQHQLATAKLQPGDPRQAAARVYQLNERAYHDAPDDSRRQPARYAAYRAQPSEAHAFMAGERLFRKLFT